MPVENLVNPLGYKYPTNLLDSIFYFYSYLRRNPVPVAFDVFRASTDDCILKMTMRISHLPQVEELVLEYLLFRGFTRSFQALAAERKRDRTKGFDVEQITAQLLAFAQSYQLEAILDTWKFLEARFFSRLDGSYTATIRQLEDAWLRLYLVNAIKNGHRERVNDFFKLLADKLNAKGGKSSGDSWHRWFILPYVQHPENDPFFRPFFEKQWLESFLLSFRNFLSLIFRNMPLPKLLALQIGRTEEPSLRLRLKTSQSECSRLRHHNAQAAQRIRQLEEAGQKMFHMVETLVHHSFAEHFTDVDSFGCSDRIPEDGVDTATVAEVLKTLSTQLQDLQDVFGPATREHLTAKDADLAAALLEDPLEVKLNVSINASRRGSLDQGGPVKTAILTPSPSSSSLQSSQSSNSPVHKTRTLEPALIEEVVVHDEISEGSHSFCKYNHNGKRLLIANSGHKSIKLYDVDPDGHMREREEVHTESPVVGVDWVAHSEYLAYALEDGTITVWDTENKARTFIISFNADERLPSYLACAHSKAIGAVALLSSEAATTDESSAFRIQFFAFEEQAIRVLSSIDLPKPTTLLSLSWAKDGSTLAIAAKDGRVTLLSPSEARVLGSWQLGSQEVGLAAIAFGPDGHSLFAIEASVTRALEWLIPDLLATFVTEAPPKTTYRLPNEFMEEGTDSVRLLEIHTARSKFAVCSSSSASCSYWTVFSRGLTEPVISTPLQVPDHIQALAWHPLDNVLTATTTTGKLYSWKLAG